jgi:uncharacterized membrane protein
LQQIKLFGIIGSALLSFGYLPGASIVLNILGYGFLGVSLYYLKNEKAFSYFLIGSILSIIAVFLFYFKIFAIITSFIIAAFSNNPILPLSVSVAVYFLIYYVLSIVSSYFLYLSFFELYKKFKKESFKYSGMFLVLGSVLTIFAIGMIFQIIGWVVLMFAFFTLEEESNLLP